MLTMLPPPLAVLPLISWAQHKPLWSEPHEMNLDALGFFPLIKALPLKCRAAYIFSSTHFERNSHWKIRNPLSVHNGIEKKNKKALVVLKFTTDLCLAPRNCQLNIICHVNPRLFNVYSWNEWTCWVIWVDLYPHACGNWADIQMKVYLVAEHVTV